MSSNERCSGIGLICNDPSERLSSKIGNEDLKNLIIRASRDEKGPEFAHIQTG